jgi:hypothetical protein
MLLRGQAPATAESGAAAPPAGDDRVVARNLREATSRLHAHAYRPPALRDGDDLAVQSQPIAERRGEGVASRWLPPSMRYIAPAPGVRVGRELIDQRDQRQLVGIGEKEPAQCPSRWRCVTHRPVNRAEPDDTDRRAKRAANWRIPSAFGQPVRFDFRPQRFRQAASSRLSPRPHDRQTARAIGRTRPTRCAESAPAEVELFGERRERPADRLRSDRRRPRRAGRQANPS